MPRNIEDLLGKELSVEDAKAILSELEDGYIADYWSARQILWKAKLEDIVQIKFAGGEGVDKPEIMRDLADSGVTHGWPEIEVDRVSGLIKIGAEFNGSSPSGGTWITVKKFQLDDCILLPSDFEKGRSNDFDGVTLAPW